MELELGLKITQTKGDLTSTTSFQMAKDSSAPIFMSTQTDSKFILTAHLKGFRKEHIGIKINEGGTQMSIKMEKPVQEMVMSGLAFHKKEVEMKGFIRVFRIPSCVDLDRIKAKFNGRDSVLTIVMPKSTKGGSLEEVGETSQASLQDKFGIIEESKQGRDAKERDESQQLEMLKDSEIKSIECGNTKDELEKVEDELLQGFKAMRDETRKLGDVEANTEEEEEEEEEAKIEEEAKKEEMSSKDSKESDQTVSSQQVSTDQKQKEEEETLKKKKKKHFQPCGIVGSSIIATLVVVFAIHWIRSSKRKQLH